MAERYEYSVEWYDCLEGRVVLIGEEWTSGSVDPVSLFFDVLLQRNTEQ